jgi:hypothetical protein
MIALLLFFVGKEFRALFVSTVRTRNSITATQKYCDTKTEYDDLSLEFLSDPKLLITAVTRAKSFLAVVGDPVALCTLGGCKRLWKDYINRCNISSGLYGTTWADLNRQIKAHSSSMTLNPEAQSFHPESEKQRPDERHQLNEGEATSDYNEFKSSTTSNGSQSVSFEDEDFKDQATSCSNVKDDSDDDDYQYLTDVDEIIKAFIKKCQEEEVSDEEFPPLNSMNAMHFFPKPDIAIPHPSTRNRSRGIDLDSLGSEYIIRRVNGREEIVLLDMHRIPSERVQQIKSNVDKQDNFDSGTLCKRVLEEGPSSYLSAQLQIGSDKFRTPYAVIEDKKRADIQVKGSIRCAFDQDTVVIDLKQNVGVFIGKLLNNYDQIYFKEKPLKPSLDSLRPYF